MKLEERCFAGNTEQRFWGSEISCASWQEGLRQEPFVCPFRALLFVSGDAGTLGIGGKTCSIGNKAENPAQQQVSHRKKVLLESRLSLASAEKLNNDAGFIELFLCRAGPQVVGFKRMPLLSVEVPGEVALDQFPLSLIDGFQYLSVCKVKVLDRAAGIFRQ